MRRTFVVALLIIGGLALMTPAALAQTGTDGPGAAVLHPVTSAGEIAPTSSWTPTGTSLWQAIAILLQQRMPAGLWEHTPWFTGPVTVNRSASGYLIPRRTTTQVGGTARP